MKKLLPLLVATFALTPAHLLFAQLSYLGQNIVPTSQTFSGTTVGGLSGIDYRPSTGSYYAISDDRSSSPANPARFYTLGLNLNQFARSNTPGQAGVTFNSVTSILTTSGTTFALNTVDPEAIRFRPSTNTLIWTSEGNRAPGNLQNPFTREMNLDGSFVREFTTPSLFNPAGSGATDPGIRNNLAFESVTLSPSGALVYTATENALVQDGPAAGVGQTTVSRILSYSTATGLSGAQYAYVADAVAQTPVPGGSFATNGLVELLAIGEQQFLAVERSFSTGVGNTIKLYFADAGAATDVSGLADLDGEIYTPLSKNLLLDLGTLVNDDATNLVLDNIEGITFGPEFNGNPTIILVSDNNFAGTQFTQFVALGVTGVIPEPGSAALLLVGAGLLARRRLRSSPI